MFAAPEPPASQESLRSASATPWAPAIDGAVPAARIAPRRIRGLLGAGLVTARPRQWIKNVVVIAAAGAAGALGHDDVPGRVMVACAAFCLLASGTYCLNDVRDAVEDRSHPRKRLRPVAAGRLSAREAIGLGVTLCIAGLIACVLISPALALVGVAYLTITISYTLVWRRMLILDLAAIASGFVLRAVAGGLAAPVELSVSFVLVVTFAALFMAAGKRYSERLRADAAGATRRPVLEHYSPSRLRLLMTVSGIGALSAYWVWALAVPALTGHLLRALTAIPFSAGFLRYARVLRSGGGEAPEDVVLGDPILICAAFAWLVLFALSVHVAG
jgi:decaprenyl-phosphate phosphoribosyltransferase